ncbi:MAG: lysylphosphatidylglycerol synthase domain-containing protein [Gammaproteobacteria bacterium]
MAAAEIALAAGLVLTLTLLAGIDTETVKDVVPHFVGWPVFAIFFLVALQVYLSARKWAFVLSRVEAHMGRPMRFYFLHTATGVIVGQLVPVHLGAAAARSAALRLDGQERPFLTASMTSLFEQLFDFFLPLAMLPVAFAAMYGIGSPSLWSVATLALAIALGIVVVSSAAAVTRSARLRALVRATLERLRVRRSLGELAPMVGGEGVRVLVWISAARFLVVLLRHAVVATALAGAVSVWDVVFLAPVVQFLALVSVTPGAIGVVEWGWAGLLHAIAAVPLAEAALFALSLRVTFVVSAAVLVLVIKAADRLLD